MDDSNETFVEIERLRVTAREHRDAFMAFARNGRWGTCANCPKDSEGKRYPECCRNTDRPDHMLALPELAHEFNKTYEALGGK